MTDKARQLLVGALRRAAAEPEPTPLHGTRTVPGLFSPTAQGRQAAQRSVTDGLVRVVHTETRGKSSHEHCSLTEKGLSYLLEHADAQDVLEDLIRALDRREVQLQQIVEHVQQTQAGLTALRGTTERVLQRLVGHDSTSYADVPALGAAILDALRRPDGSAAGQDCPLPEVLRHVRAAFPNLTIGQFHDELRRLHEQQQVYLHPWTGPLYALPEPPCALLVGHEIAYYASLR